MNKWRVMKLNEVCKIGDGNHSSNYPKNNEMVNEGIPFIRANNMVNGNVSWQDMKFITKEKHAILKKGHLKSGDILFTNRGEIGKIAIVGSDFENSNLNSQIAWFRCSVEIKNKFLFYLLMSPALINHYTLEKNGAALQQFTIRQINDIEIPVPPIPEQQHIVSILDKAFAAIAKAKANAGQNLKNAQELFESYLQSVFENKGANWEQKTLNEISENLDSKRIPITKNVRKSGEYPYYGASGIVDYVSEYIFDEDLLCVSEDGANLLARTYPIAFPITGKTWVNNHAHVLRFENLISQQFVELYLNSIKLDDFVSGMAQPKLNQTMLNKIPVPFPPLKEQKDIVQKLNALSTQTKKLESIYQKKIFDLEELKKSILQKAFSGQLKTKEIVL